MAASAVWDAAEDCSTASAAAFRAALASALSFSRQQRLYLRPEPQWHGSLRPGRAIVVAVIERVYCNRMHSTEGHVAGDNVSDRVLCADSPCSGDPHVLRAQSLVAAAGLEDDRLALAQLLEH